MPIPFILGAAAVTAGAIGATSAVKGGKKMKEANETMKDAESRHKNNIKYFEDQSKRTSISMDKVGTKELEILDSFNEFIKIFEKIHNKPKFSGVTTEGVTLPTYDYEELKNFSIGAGVLLGGIGGATVGTAGGFAAAGATTAAVMALGTASTGTAIASLTGVAATNAALAALGGGAVAAGGGGMALGSAVLSGATLGVGLLVGGIIFNITGSSLSNKADEAYAQMKKAEEEIKNICIYLVDLRNSAEKFYITLIKANEIYCEHMKKLHSIVEINGKTNWALFTPEEKLTTENTVLLVRILLNMCKVKLVKGSEKEDGSNQVNSIEIDNSISDTNKLLLKIN